MRGYACVAAGVAFVVRRGRDPADTGATLPHAWGKGAARSVLAALPDWVGAHEADRMDLQGECDNVPALRLYERTGSTKCALTTTAPRMNLVICTWRTTVYHVGVLDVLADLPV
jgi:hypothetical protein